MPKNLFAIAIKKLKKKSNNVPTKTTLLKSKVGGSFSTELTELEEHYGEMLGEGAYGIVYEINKNVRLRFAGCY